jgi:hypothetical protein
MLKKRPSPISFATSIRQLLCPNPCAGQADLEILSSRFQTGAGTSQAQWENQTGLFQNIYWAITGLRRSAFAASVASAICRRLPSGN